MSHYDSQKRWRAKNPDKRKVSRQRNYAARDFSTQPKRPWTLEEIDTLKTWAQSDTELAKRIQRSVLAVQVKRCKLLGGY